MKWKIVKLLNSSEIYDRQINYHALPQEQKIEKKEVKNLVQKNYNAAFPSRRLLVQSQPWNH